MYIQSINSIKQQLKRHLGFGVFIDMYLVHETHSAVSSLPQDNTHLLVQTGCKMTLFRSAGTKVQILYVRKTQRLTFVFAHKSYKAYSDLLSSRTTVEKLLCWSKNTKNSTIHSLTFFADIHYKRAYLLGSATQWKKLPS